MGSGRVKTTGTDYYTEDPGGLLVLGKHPTEWSTLYKDDRTVERCRRNKERNDRQSVESIKVK